MDFNKKIQRLISLFGESNKSLNWNFLSLYKVIKNFCGKREKDDWISKIAKLAKDYKNDKDNPITIITKKRIDIAHLNYPDIF